MENTTSKYIAVKESKIHNKGIFASKRIPKGTKIIQYVGELISKEDADDRADIQLNRSKDNKEDGSVYIFELDDDHDIDGNVPYNTARYINHSCNPNCEAIIYGDEIWIVALRDIEEGEELSYNYGYDLENFQDHPCKCGSHNCVGYIVDEDLWPELTAKISRC